MSTRVNIASKRKCVAWCIGMWHPNHFQEETKAATSLGVQASGVNVPLGGAALVLRSMYNNILLPFPEYTSPFNDHGIFTDLSDMLANIEQGSMQNPTFPTAKLPSKRKEGSVPYLRIVRRQGDTDINEHQQQQKKPL